MATIGFIGLGIMGAHMARNLLKGDHQLVVNGAFPIPEDLRTSAKVVANSTEVARNADIIISMVPDTPDVRNVLFADDGVAARVVHLALPQTISQRLRCDIDKLDLARDIDQGIGNRFMHRRAGDLPDSVRA